jgi:hypothetical protein
MSVTLLPNPNLMVAANRRRALRTGVRLTIASAVIGAAGVRAIDAGQSGDAGLITAVGPLYLLGLALLVVAFVVTVRDELAPSWLLATQLGLFIVGVHGLPALVEAHPRFFSAYLHAGFTDYIVRHGSVNQLLDARMSWPGFFSLVAMMQRAAGIDSALWFIRWFPVIATSLYLAPAALLCRSIGASRRAGWATMWAIVTFNWVGQDYFSPQALALLLYLSVVAIALTAFAGDGWSPVRSHRLRRLKAEYRPSRAERFDGSSLLALYSMLLCSIAALTVSHQLTPFLLPGILGLLVITGRMRLKTLPFIAAACAIAWLSLGAASFWKGHLDLVFSGFGAVGSNVTAGLANRSGAVSSGRQMMLDVRIALTALLLVAAATGFARRARQRAIHLALLTLTFAPFALVIAQRYGGESLLRAAFFALIPGACLAGVAIFPEQADVEVPPRQLRIRRRRTRSRYTAATSVAVLLLAIGCVTARFGNEQFEQVGDGDWGATHWIYAHAQPGDTVVAVARSLPWRYRDLESLRDVPIGDQI